MKRLIECVPNFSEGRDPVKMDAICAAMSGIPGACILDRTSDPDHNRSVITIAGEPEAVAEAVLLGVEVAARLIDMTRHTGAHPRIGAADVIPFIPIENYSMDECVALARSFGREIWERYRIPVYFYEAAATRPERVNLEDIRRGEFEGLRDAALTDPDRSPDIGEPRLHPTAGAIAVSARKFLIAYNIHLSTNDVSIAAQIARAIRFSSGGLRHVKAIGVHLQTRNLAQVSINLTDFEATPLHRVFEMVRREAERHGHGIVGSEIIGLVPGKALEMASEFYLQLENFSSSQILENRLSEFRAVLQPLAAETAPSLARLARPLLNAVAAPVPTPAGGTVSALAGAMAASLGEMVAALTRNKKSSASFSEELIALANSLHLESETLLAAMDRDARAYEAVMAAQKLPRETAEERVQRDKAIDHAARYAIAVPLEIAMAGCNVFETLLELETMAAPSMLADLRVARLMASVAARGSLLNVSANLAMIQDPIYASDTKRRTAAIEARLAAHPETAGDVIKNAGQSR